MDEFVEIVNSGNTPDIGRVGRVIRYLDWGGFVIELDDDNIVTLALGDVEILAQEAGKENEHVR